MRRCAHHKQFTQTANAVYEWRVNSVMLARQREKCRAKESNQKAMQFDNKIVRWRTRI
jgi:hypothetical protein